MPFLRDTTLINKELETARHLLEERDDKKIITGEL